MSNPHDSSLPNALRDRGLTTFCVNRRRREMYCGHERLCVCVPVCLSVRGRTPTLLHAPGCNLGHGGGCLLVVHYWADLQSGHALRCYGNITRTLVTSLRPSRDMTTQCERPTGQGLRALLAADWRVTAGVLKIARRIWKVGVASSPVIGRRRTAFSTLLRLPGMRPSSDGVLATKSERKMLASTCLYSLYAWLLLSTMDTLMLV